MSLYIGLMSGTSLDGVDGALARFSGDAIDTLAAAYVPFPPALRAELMALQAAGHNEIEREALAANQLARHYADCVQALLDDASLQAQDIRAVAVHGQTIRHRPELGFTRQTNNPALLAELCGIDVIADFRSRDIAAGGQGAPLVPAFHQALFGKPGQTRVVANIGGISNISVLADGKVTGFDTGPGNVLMDAWIGRHQGKEFDQDGAWAASGKEIPGLLANMLAEPYFALPAPKSTGRDLFHINWLDRHLAAFPAAAPADVQRTLTRLTALTLAQAIQAHGAGADAVYVCGGGACNGVLMDELGAALGARVVVASTQALGVAPNRVEAMAFAWLGYRFTERLAGNLPSVTGASGDRVLGALYPR
ncbi:anhydro-N-acetylmuramic acid kinase [Duganella sp. BJB488]|uniref:anhydro-N-acetylmuramic acid kinase n=1 Tax=unclassified Duganella TaxID=2636909 RepID=UPI000E34A2F5|nr:MULTISPECIES: anhydro-N-acetylmuramic acid kinase [unclassified Duganella]RFP22788.1 anhydro-N-acetylmuramic acid kinase [Duganella sp. BJB489]RFP25138.1 anhydro-N-acetylmuramic acid kinase [Duganella sp. BJB488]RFP33785.1 anhydro-N-acetylmuramic acid kinase [Duganella sp. BJB480]